MKQYLNETQTAKLIELGFEKPKSIIYASAYQEEEGAAPDVEYEYAYSIGDLIEMLMKVNGVKIPFESMHGGRLKLIVKRLVDNKWDILYGKVGKELIDLLLDATVKLKEGGVI